MSARIFSSTPTVSVTCSRGLVVRDFAYHRHPDAPDATDVRITRDQYHARGFLAQSAMSVRNFRTAVGSTDDSSWVVTCTWQYEEAPLSGRLLRITERVTTSRLHLRPVIISDADDLFRIYGDPATNTSNPADPYPDMIMPMMFWLAGLNTGRITVSETAPSR